MMTRIYLLCTIEKKKVPKNEDFRFPHVAGLGMGYTVSHFSRFSDITSVQLRSFVLLVDRCQ